MMDISIIGAGNAGCITALCCQHFKELNPNFIGDIFIYHDPSIPTETVGQGVLPDDTYLIADLLGVDCNNNSILYTAKNGNMYEGWGKVREKIFHPFPLGNTSMHYIPKLFCREVLKSGYFKVIEKNILNPEEELSQDLIFDCRGKLDRDNNFYEKLINPLNAVIISNKKIDYMFRKNNFNHKLENDFEYTRAVATPDGWTFVIPNHDSVSYGYLYNSNISKEMDARKNFKKQFGIKSGLKIDFDNYVAKNIFSGQRTVLNGNRLFFLEPLESTSTDTYATVCNTILVGMMEGYSHEDLNIGIKEFIKQIETFILWHYQFGSNYDSDFWDYAKSLPFKPDSNFNEMLETKNRKLYGQWTRASFGNWLKGVT
jgi:hypothetical protein